MTRPPFTATWIEGGKILAGSMPTSSDEIRNLKTMNIRAILSLTRRNILDCPQIAEEVAGKLYHCIAPIPDGGLADDATMRQAIDFIAWTQENDYPIYVHCRGGIGRTGMILIAYYVLKRGLTLADARARLSVRRNYEGNATAADQGSPQKEWLDALEKRSDGA